MNSKQPRDSYLPANGNSGYRILSYDLKLDARPGPGRLSGRALLLAAATEPLSRFSLDLADLRVSRVTVDGARPAKYVHGNGKLRVRCARPIPAGSEFSVEVRYAGTPEPINTVHWGELGWDQLSDGALVASQPIGAPSWFPCNDHPQDKAAYRFTITAPAPYTVVANGTLVSTQVGAGSRTWVYEQPEPTPSYLATVQIGQYESLPLSDSPVRSTLVAPASLLALARNDFARQSEMLDVFGELFGAYPFSGYTVVVTEDELEVPVEAQNVSIFGANHVDGRRGWERLVAHELAHQWFGNSLTVADWRHIWLNEGFAAYAEWLWSEHLWSHHGSGQPAATHAATAHALLRTLPADLVLADPGVENMFDDRVYKRGPLTLHALRRAIGDGAFFTLLRAWAGKYRYGSVGTEDFIALANEYGEVTDLLHRWLYRAELPELD